MQMMHIGPYDDEPQTVAQMETYSKDNNYRSAIGDRLPDGTVRRHHEIYLSDPRKTIAAKMKTVVRHPIKN